MNSYPIDRKPKPNPKLFQVWFERGHNAIFGGNFRTSLAAEREVAYNAKRKAEGLFDLTEADLKALEENARKLQEKESKND